MRCTALRSKSLLPKNRLENIYNIRILRLMSSLPASTSKNEVKFVPTIAQVLACSKLLPDASLEKIPSKDIEIEGKKGVKLTFDRIKYVGKDGIGVARWSYKGRILVDKI